MVRAARHDRRPLAPVSVALGAWGLSYALYRGYYAVGGTLLLPGRPADPVQFRLINAVAAVILVIAAALPIDHRAADLQDLFFNEPWFLVEGLGFGALGWIVLGSGRRRRWWVGTAITAISVLTVIGMLSATGVILKTIIG